MFDEIAAGYDRGNDAITLGMHRGWKRRLVSMLGLHGEECALDLATGTGDIAADIAGRLRGIGEVVGLDFSARMIDMAICMASR